MAVFEQIAHSIFAIDKYSRLYLRNELKPHGLNQAEGLVLMSFYCKAAHPECAAIQAGKTQEKLVDELHCDKSVMTRTMQSLEQKGYLVRSGNPGDKRSYLFSLTQKGRAFEPSLTKLVEDWRNKLMEELDDTTLEVISQGLRKMAEKAIEKSRPL